MPKRKRAETTNKNAGSPESHDGQDSTYGTQSPAIAECPFTIDYVHRPSTGTKGKKTRKSAGNSSDKSSERVEEDVPSEDLEIAYVIRPGTLWNAMNKYRNFVVGDETFGVNDFVSVNHSNIAHGEVLDEKLFWVARVLEVRAKDPQNVYLRVFWMYWPEELPMGAQSYHGKHELIASNHMEIIDAMTVASKASVSHWLEKDEEKVLDALYWRQTFNFQTQTLSDLRKHCTCHQCYNPDNTLIGCSHSDCNLWMHEQCVIDDTLQRTYERLVGDAETNEIETQKPPSKKGRRKSSKPKTPTHPWDGLFSASIVPRDSEPSDTNTENDNDNDTAPDSTHDFETDIKSAGKIVITDLRTPSDGESEDQKVWEEDIICLGCRQKIK